MYTIIVILTFIRYLATKINLLHSCDLNINVILTLASVRSSVIKRPHFIGQLVYPTILSSFSNCSVCTAGHWHKHDFDVILEKELLFKGGGGNEEMLF